MKIAKRLLSVTLALVMLVSLFAFDFNASATPGIHSIHRVDITLRTDIAGKKYWDYKPEEVFSVDTENLKIADCNLPLRIYKEDGDFANRLVAGKTYEVYVYVQTEANTFYELGMDVYVNGVKIPSDQFERQGDGILWVNCGYYKITNNKDIFFLSRWFNAIFEMFGM